MLQIENANASLIIDEEKGGRLTSLVIFGDETLVTSDDSLLCWGCYPMAPWAGRIRNAEFLFGGVVHRLPPTAPPHAIHGTLWDRPWRSDPDGSLITDLGPDWPFDGFARQRFSLLQDRLIMTLEVHTTGTAFPASLGWHPWFRRSLGETAQAALSFRARHMMQVDDQLIPTGHWIPPTKGPWDDCFTELTAPPSITWPGRLTLFLTSDCLHWVIYDQQPTGLCVEPMTAPPNSLNAQPSLVTKEAPLSAQFTIRWQRDAR